MNKCSSQISHFLVVLISFRAIYVCQRTWVIAIMILKPKKVVVVDDNDQDAGENYDYGPIWLGL